MFSPLSNMKTSDKTSKSSLRDVFKADVVFYDKTILTSFPIIKRNFSDHRCTIAVLTKYVSRCNHERKKNKIDQAF